jgi:cytochrome o ubiquinol oxidase subunit 1
MREVICVLAYTVWLHHFFTMGASANVNAFFGVASMIIAVPTGVKINLRGRSVRPCSAN